jgi:glycine cleavage system H protein
MNLPNGLLYTEEHEWIRVEGNIAIIGITDFAQSELGDIVFVELPAEGADVTVGDVFGSVESVKTVSELYSPVSGKVIAVNTKLEDSPENVNEAAYEAGWMIKIKFTDESELAKLLSAEQYQASVS